MPKRDLVGKSLIVVWMIVTVAGLAALSVEHMASLPQPADVERLSRAMLPLRANSGQNFLVHVIYGECSCATALFAHLMARRPLPGAGETILFVGAGSLQKESARRAGFTFATVSAKELSSRFGLEAAPVLLMFNAAGELRYAGGYFAHPAALAPLDQKIYAQVTAGVQVQPLPVFGCAVSPRLRESLNPLRAVIPGG